LLPYLIPIHNAISVHTGPPFRQPDLWHTRILPDRVSGGAFPVKCKRRHGLVNALIGIAHGSMGRKYLVDSATY